MPRTAALTVAALCVTACGRREEAGHGKSGGSARGSGRAVPEGAGHSLRRAVERVTGSHTRIVWLRDLGPGKDAFANGGELVLMGLDTRLPQAETVLSGQKANYSRPLLTPDGQSVVFSRRTPSGDPALPQWTSAIYLKSGSWTADSTEAAAPVKLRAGYAVDVWAEPGNGRPWVYALERLRDGISANPEGYHLFRFPLAEPDKTETVWEEGLLSGDNIQLNRAGTAASGLIPWPNAGTFDFTAGRFIRYRNGCWPSLAPDDSGVMWVFDGTHENLRFFLPGVDDNWRVPLGELEALKGRAAYHPRWSNHPRVIGFTGPHPVRVDQGSGRVSVLVARFNEALTAVEDSVSLKNKSGEPDCYPDVWTAAGMAGASGDLNPLAVGPGRIRGLAAAAAASRPGTGAPEWSPAPEGLCFVWGRANYNNRIPEARRESSVTPARWARYGPRFDMLTEGGTFHVDAESADAMRSALQSGPWSMEMAVTPLATGNEVPQVIFRAGPDLEIQQSLHDFIVRTGGRDWQLGAGLAPNLTTHLVLGSAAEAGRAPSVWINGQSQDVRPVEVQLRKTLAPSEGTGVLFGAREDGSAAWSGRLEAVAFHARPPDPARTDAHAAWWRARLGKTTPPARTVVRARLKEASPRAAPADIGTYHRAWTSALYEKTALVSGPDPGPVFGAAHWTILDKTPLPGGPPGNPGDETELTLEPMSAHPEMESEFGTEEVLGDEPFFLDTGFPGSGGGNP